MTVSAQGAISGVPVVRDDTYVTVNASGTALIINPGDYVIFSGNYAVATALGAAGGGAKSSGLGVALDRNPAYDWAGRQVINSALLVATRGIFHVSANFSGQPKLGVVAYSDATGSGVNTPTGVTGKAATWQTANPVSVSGATAAAVNPAVAQVIAWNAAGNGGTGEMDIRLWPRQADYY